MGDKVMSIVRAYKKDCNTRIMILFYWVFCACPWNQGEGRRKREVLKKKISSGSKNEKEPGQVDKSKHVTPPLSPTNSHRSRLKPKADEYVLTIDFIMAIFKSSSCEGKAHTWYQNRVGNQQPEGPEDATGWQRIALDIASNMGRGNIKRDNLLRPLPIYEP